MSTWGVDIRNSNNGIRIDQNYQSMVTLHDPVSLSLTFNFFGAWLTPGPPPATLYLPVQWPGAPQPAFSTSPILWTRSYSTAVTTHLLYESGYCTRYYAVNSTYGTHTVDLVWSCIATSGQLKYPSNWGLRINRSDGSEAFDSRRRHVIIRDVIVVDPPLNTTYYNVAHATCTGSPWYAVSKVASGPYTATGGDDHRTATAFVQNVSNSSCHVVRVKDFASDTATWPVTILVGDIL